jgi:6-phospho-3-hexuloisomerase
MDDWLIMVDYSETHPLLHYYYDLHFTLFPESPPFQANNLIVAVELSARFANINKRAMDLSNTSDEQLIRSVKDNLKLVIEENLRLSRIIDYTKLPAMLKHICSANAIFLIAAGRSGFAMKSTAMRLMHLGFQVYFVGETSTPSIKEGDLLWAASGSGTTATIVRAAEVAKRVGAKVIATTAAATSPLVDLSDVYLLVPAAGKEEHGSSKSNQYAGSLFEQALLLLHDAIFQSLWTIDGTPAEELWKRHANLE